MYKKIPNSKQNAKKREPKKPWFNTICKESVTNYKIISKSIPRQDINLRNSELKKLAKKHRKIIRKEKRKYDNEINKKLK